MIARFARIFSRVFFKSWCMYLGNSLLKKDMSSSPLLRTLAPSSCRRKETGQKGDSQITIFRRALAVIWTLQTPEKKPLCKKPNFRFKRSWWNFSTNLRDASPSCTLISFLFEFLISRFATWWALLRAKQIVRAKNIRVVHTWAKFRLLWKNRTFDENLWVFAKITKIHFLIKMQKTKKLGFATVCEWYLVMNFSSKIAKVETLEDSGHFVANLADSSLWYQPITVCENHQKCLIFISWKYEEVVPQKSEFHKHFTKENRRRLSKSENGVFLRHLPILADKKTLVQMSR